MEVKEFEMPDGSKISVPNGEYKTYCKDQLIEEDVKTIKFSDLSASEIFIIFNGRENNVDDSLANNNGKDSFSVNGEISYSGIFTYIRKEGNNFDTTVSVKANKTLNVIDGLIHPRGNKSIYGFEKIVSGSIINSFSITTNNFFKSGSKISVYFKDGGD